MKRSYTANDLRSKADSARRRAEAAQRIAQHELQVAEEAEAAAEQNEEKVRKNTLKKLRSGTRDRNAIDCAVETINMRYSANSTFSRLDVKTFTLLVERINIRTLRHFCDRGIADEVLQATQKMMLPEPFWLDYHASIKSSDHNLSKLYWMEITDYLYPPIAASLTQQDVLYSIAYVYKTQLNKYFKPPFVKRMEALYTWGGDKTTSCVRAHIRPEGVDFEVDLGVVNLEPGSSDILQDHVASYEGVRIETIKVNQLRVYVPSDLGTIMVNDLSFPQIKRI